MRQGVLDISPFQPGLQIANVYRKGLGMRTLFSGPHGTGKTLASEVVAGRLAVDLHSVALEAVVSKYIGETEKNLCPCQGTSFDSLCSLFDNR